MVLDQVRDRIGAIRADRVAGRVVKAMVGKVATGRKVVMAARREDMAAATVAADMVAVREATDRSTVRLATAHKVMVRKAMARRVTAARVMARNLRMAGSPDTGRVD